MPEGITAAGRAPVRPDGVVRWRTLDAAGASETTMGSALTSLLRRQG